MRRTTLIFVLLILLMASVKLLKGREEILLSQTSEPTLIVRIEP